MKGDIIIIEEHHRKAAKAIAAEIYPIIKQHTGRYSITVAGESGSGKSETAQAIADELNSYEITSIVLGQDDYFHFPPKLNDAKRRENRDWLGPHVEVNFPALQKNIDDALLGSSKLEKPIIDYNVAVIGNEEIDISDVKVIITEGTYTSLLKNIHTKIFIDRNRIDTLEHRKKRNRGNEVHDPFVEEILKTEHKIIAGHIFLSDLVITNEFNVEQRALSN
ncbi:MAG: zeta toxin family protein [Desulfobacteraceae bacterium]|jgi:uridine kinase